jgi:homotetrameric cytidine deaminase
MEKRLEEEAECLWRHSLVARAQIRLASRFMTSADENRPIQRGQVESRLDPALRQLVERAREAAANSHSPYSGFKVGAALKLNNGETVTGTNVENVSYGLTICAERAAVVQAVSRFGPKMRIEAVAIDNLNAGASPPCGGCRQFLAEFIEPDAPVVFPLADGVCVLSFSKLMPLACELKLK